jgi:hypothetical protein
MRNLLTILLICLLPFQISWATAAEYCAHEPAKSIHHFGHHADEHHAQPNTPDQDNHSDKAGLGHDHSHLSGYLAIVSTFPIVIGEASGTVLSPPSNAYTHLLPYKPEKPNWPATAMLGEAGYLRA